MNFKKLIKRCSKNDTEALNEFAKRYYSLVYSIIEKKIGKQENVEDLTQDLFVNIIKSNAISKFKGDTEKEFIGYLAKITYYTVSQNFKKFSLNEKIIISDNVFEQNYSFLFTEETPLEKIIDNEIRERLDSAIANLPLNYRNIINLKLLSYTNTEIAKILKKPKGTIDTWSSRSLEILRNELKDLNSNWIK